MTAGWLHPRVVFHVPTSLKLLTGTLNHIFFNSFQSLAKSPALRGQICGKISAKRPCSQEADNIVEQQLVVFLMQLKYERGD